MAKKIEFDRNWSEQPYKNIKKNLVMCVCILFSQIVSCLYKEVYLQIFKRVSFWLHGSCGDREVWARKPG